MELFGFSGIFVYLCKQRITILIMILTFFENMKRMVKAVKDDSNFIKKYGKDFMRAFQEEMEYTALNAIIDPSIDFTTELDRIEKEYCFNEDMQILLSAVSPSVRWAVICHHCDLIRNSNESKEAEVQVKEYCRLNMEQMTCVEVNIEQKYSRIGDETDKLLKDLKVLLKERDN